MGPPQGSFFLNADVQLVLLHPALFAYCIQSCDYVRQLPIVPIHPLARSEVTSFPPVVGCHIHGLVVAIEHPQRSARRRRLPL